MHTRTIGALLGEYLADTRREPFDWARNNCCHFAARWVARATGADPMAGLPATATAREARRLVRRLGGTLADAWTHALGRGPIVPALAQVGDVVLIDVALLPVPDGAPPAPDGAERGTGQAVGLCAGRTAVVMDAAGVCHHVPMDEARFAWRLFAAPAAAAPAEAPA